LVSLRKMMVQGPWDVKPEFAKQMQKDIDRIGELLGIRAVNKEGTVNYGYSPIKAWATARAAKPELVEDDDSRLLRYLNGGLAVAQRTNQPEVADLFREEIDKVESRIAKERQK